MPAKERGTRVVKVGNVKIGGGAPIAIQSMTTTDTRDSAATIKQINQLAAAGCEIVRVAVPDEAAAAAIAEIKPRVTIPIVADVHFDHNLAILAMLNGADKLRINPGNIGSPERVAEVAGVAALMRVPIRVGVNAGSLERRMLERHGGPTTDALVESALEHTRLLEDAGFHDIVIAVKASGVPQTIEAYEKLYERTDHPLHVGITESGPPSRGIVKSAVGIGAILARGIGDTIRVSLTGDPLEEVKCAKAILEALNLRRFGAELVSCPTCGRTMVDLVTLVARVERLCDAITKPIKIAVMGCAVNGPGEARDADVGVACGKGTGVIFRKGEIIRTVPEAEILDALSDEIDKL